MDSTPPSESPGPAPDRAETDRRPLLAWFGVDRAVVYGVMAKVFAGVFGLVTILLIAWRLPRETQGYYYTFLSLVALQVFAEMGLGIVVIQFASHYWASLRLDGAGRIEGEEQARAGLVSLGRLSLRWYGVSGVAASVLIGAAGCAFFSRASDGVEWRASWMTLCALTGLRMWLIPAWSLLEGCNQVASVYRFRFLSTVLAGVLVAATLLAGGGLWAPATGVGAEVLVGLILLVCRHRPFIRSFFGPAGAAAVDWRKEIFPLQLRVALTWMAGFFVTSFFTPVLFHFHGAAPAGQWGMTWSMFSMVTGISLTWVSSRAPQFGMWVARREFGLLDRHFWRLTKISFSLAVLGTLTVWIALLLLHRSGHPLAARILPPLPAALLGISVVLMNVPFAQSIYLRAHKQEPFLVPSVVQGVLVGLAVVLLGRPFGALGIAAGYFAIVIVVAIPWSVLLWVRCRAAWHAPGAREG